MVPVYHCLYEEGVLVLLCVIDRQLEAASISDFVTISYVYGLKVLILDGSYPSAASTHRGQVVFCCCCCLFVLFCFALFVFCFCFSFCFCFVLFCFVLFFFLGGGGGGRGGMAGMRPPVIFT